MTANDKTLLSEFSTHTDLGHVELSRAGIAAFRRASDSRACTEYCIAAYLEAAAGAGE